MKKIEIIKSKFLKNLFDQNTYILERDSSAVIIDAGAELDDIKNVLGKKKVIAILMTHLHFDHFWNLDEYLKYFNCPVYIKQGAENKFIDASLNGSMVIRTEITKDIPQKNIKYYADKLTLEDFEFEVYSTPGHAKDCVCIKYNDILFTGDTVFDDSIGRTDLKDSDNNQMIESLKLIKSLEYKTAFPGHYTEASKKQIDKIIDSYL